MCSNRESRMFPLTMITPSESIISSPPGVNRTKLELYMKCGEAFVSLALSAAPPCSPCVTLSFVVLRGSQEVMLLRGRAEYCCLWLQTSCLCVCVCVCVCVCLLYACCISSPLYQRWPVCLWSKLSVGSKTGFCTLQASRLLVWNSFHEWCCSV